jgi:hypothetical protein
MRLIREITSEEMNFRTEVLSGFTVFRQDPVEAEPVGTIVMMPFRVVGFDPDCDGSLMARLEHVGMDPLELESALEDIDKDHFHLRNFGLYPCTGFVVTVDELKEMKKELKEQQE